MHTNISLRSTSSDNAEHVWLLMFSWPGFCNGSRVLIVIHILDINNNRNDATVSHKMNHYHYDKGQK